jgi:hypothetical protein
MPAKSRALRTEHTTVTPEAAQRNRARFASTTSRLPILRHCRRTFVQAGTHTSPWLCPEMEVTRLRRIRSLLSGTVRVAVDLILSRLRKILLAPFGLPPIGMPGRARRSLRLNETALR